MECTKFLSSEKKAGRREQEEKEREKNKKMHSLLFVFFFAFTSDPPHTYQLSFEEFL